MEIAVDAVSGNVSVRQLAAALGDLDIASVATVGIIGTIGESLWSMAKAATNTAVSLEALHDVYGVDPHTTEQWEKEAERFDIHASTIISGITGVAKAMDDVAARRKGLDQSFSALQINPIDAATGKLKQYYALIKDVGAPGSVFWKLNPSIQRERIPGIFPGTDMGETYRLLQLVRNGQWTPENINTTSNSTDLKLRGTERQWTGLVQDVSQVFKDFLLAGDAAAKVMGGATSLMSEIDRWLNSREGKSLMGRIAGGISHPADTLANAAFGLYTYDKWGDVAHWIHGHNPGARASELAMIAAAAALKNNPSGRMAGNAAVEINIHDKRGQKSREEMSITGHAVGDVSTRAGNGGR